MTKPTTELTMKKKIGYKIVIKSNIEETQRVAILLVSLLLTRLKYKKWNNIPGRSPYLIRRRVKVK